MQVNYKYRLLAHCSLLALVDIPTGRLAGIVVVNHEGGAQITFIAQAHQGHHGNYGG